VGFYFYITLNFSLLISGVIAIFRFSSLEKTFYPFILFLWIGCLNETLSLMLLLHGKETIVNNNIYVLIEALLLTRFFYELRYFKSKPLFTLSMVALVLFWLVDTLFIRSIREQNLFFQIIFSFFIVIMSIGALNTRVFSSRKSILKEAVPLLYLSFIIYFTYKALILAFAIYGVNSNSPFLLNIYIIMIYVNFFVNLLYALAVVWMPRKNRFTPLYSSLSASSAVSLLILLSP
jgi:hypothetical protein